MSTNVASSTAPVTLTEGAKKEIKAQTKRINRDDWREFVGALKTGPKDMSLTINDIYK